MQTSRGCPYSCAYCHISKAGDAAKLRMKSDDRVMKEVRTIQALGAEWIFFEDDSLLAHRKRISRILHAMSTTGLRLADLNGINLAHLFRRRSDGALEVDVDLLRLLRDAGMEELAFPFESGSQRIVDSYASRKWNKDQHDMGKLVELARQHGIRTSGYFTIGYPDESLDELTDTIMFAQEMMMAGLGSVAFYIIQAYPGTTLYDTAMRSGQIPDDIPFHQMRFAIPNLINTAISRETLAYTRRLAYRLLNNDKYLRSEAIRDLDGRVATARQLLNDGLTRDEVVAALGERYGVPHDLAPNVVASALQTNGRTAQ